MSDYIRPVTPEDKRIFPLLKDEKWIVCKSHGKKQPISKEIIQNIALYAGVNYEG